MALTIESGEADRLARDLAALTNESLTEAVTAALRERLARVRIQQADVATRLDRLMVEYTAHPAADARSAEELIGYDAAGLPT